MQFVEEQSNSVTDITIPEGNVIKIEEADTGRVLWEKKLNAHWEYIQFQQPELYDKSLKYRIYDYIDDGEKLIFFGTNFISTTLDNQKYSIFKIEYLNNSSQSDLNILTQINDTASSISADIDNISKQWYVFSYNCIINSTGIINNITVGDSTRGLYGIYCPEKNICCAVKIYHPLADSLFGASYTFDKNCNMLNSKEGLGNDINFNGSKICWAPKLEKFFAINQDQYAQTSRPIPIYSTNGISWKKCSIVDDSFLDTPKSCLKDIQWVSEQDILITIVYCNDTSYIYTSIDGIAWTKKSQIQDVCLACAWSPTKKLLCIIGQKTSYISKDFKTWIEIPYKDENMTISTRLKWSSTLNSFVVCPRKYGCGAYQMILEG